MRSRPDESAPRVVTILDGPTGLAVHCEDSVSEVDELQAALATMEETGD
eukprot:CAMPEP_0172640180 /NCGR_PEP_ID=MMETSP1068-20121228/221938_1 /TAXON_ID=35684 /ORGANISM="Pseudopedinella elastica, Strain CCMP716" /LENGTH=48 /DNA_ID= /DNA_START= /DNA_END= /DNA_ORIENTATION=